MVETRQQTKLNKSTFLISQSEKRSLEINLITQDFAFKIFLLLRWIYFSRI